MASSFLDFCPEIRCLIYQHVFAQTNGQILALSREPEHDYNNGPPDDWIADSRQEGLVYGTETARLEPTNSRFLRTCRTIKDEAAPVFYGRNKIMLYAEDNNDIFYWLLDIGEYNRRAIRHVEISWAYGVSIESGRGNIHGILQKIHDMESVEEEQVQKHRQQLIHVIQRLERNTVRLIIRTLNLLVTNQDLNSLGVYLPGVDGGDMWDLPNENLYFAEEIFSNSTTNVHACIPQAISKMLGIKSLTIGYTKDIKLAEQIARAAGAKELIIRTCPEANTLNLNNKERALWIERGWRLVGATAVKTLVEESTEQPVPEDQLQHEMEQQCQQAELQRSLSYEGYSEGGRLKADMEYERPADSRIDN